MSSHTVQISLRAAGGSQVAGELGRIGSASQNLSGDVKKLGSVFGETGRQIGDFASSILKGGIIGIIVAVISGIISIYKKWADAAKEAAEAAAKEVRESLDRQKKHITDYMSAVERAAQASKQWISNNLTLRQKEIAATKSLTVATLELEKAQARARGDKAGVQRIEQEIAHTDESAQRNALEAQRKAAFQRMNAARNQVSDMERGIDMQRLLLRNIKAEIAAGENKARESVGSGEDAMPAIREYRKSDEYKELVNRGDAAAKQLRAFQDAQMRAKYEKDQATADLAAAKKAIAAFETRLSAARINTELDEGDKYKVEEKKEIEAIAALQKKNAEERRKLELDAVKERARMEREAHQRRMADIRAELAEQGNAAGILKSRSAAAQSEFDRAFAMFRDPSRAAAEIGEEKSYAADLDRLHRSARQYGGKWRIDELSRLMAAGDTRGVADTLNAWRKTKGFTPEVEAMVRASAAENVKTTVEDELRKIDDKVASMNDVLKQMADAQSGKLGSIADSTSGLAAKVDQLLKVKG